MSTQESNRDNSVNSITDKESLKLVLTAAGVELTYQIVDKIVPVADLLSNKAQTLDIKFVGHGALVITSTWAAAFLTWHFGDRIIDNFLKDNPKG